ncbi:Hypothetical predicted protein [Olea europaea subsp. europaea]|uniref:Uncharacterized protein n=1 Tax=Olea europaea subsp. europaea TaxID=158383 RepID=A0A8S0R2U8_OLEEU|nr:Hypothetical predicted protein [Olea europaea subsp. europaea]
MTEPELPMTPPAVWKRQKRRNPHAPAGEESVNLNLASCHCASRCYNDENLGCLTGGIFQDDGGDGGSNGVCVGCGDLGGVGGDDAHFGEVVVVLNYCCFVVVVVAVAMTVMGGCL